MSGLQYAQSPAAMDQAANNSLMNAAGGKTWWDNLGSKIQSQFTWYQLNIENLLSSTKTVMIFAPEYKPAAGKATEQSANFPSKDDTASAFSVKGKPSSIDVLQYFAKHNPMFIPFMKIKTDGNSANQFAEDIELRSVDPFNKQEPIDDVITDVFEDPYQDNQDVLFVDQAFQFNNQRWLELSVIGNSTLTVSFPFYIIQNQAAELDQMIKRMQAGMSEFQEV